MPNLLSYMFEMSRREGVNNIINKPEQALIKKSALAMRHGCLQLKKNNLQKCYTLGQNTDKLY